MGWLDKFRKEAPPLFVCTFMSNSSSNGPCVGANTPLDVRVATLLSARFKEVMVSERSRRHSVGQGWYWCLTEVRVFEIARQVVEQPRGLEAA